MLPKGAQHIQEIRNRKAQYWCLCFQILTILKNKAGGQFDSVITVNNYYY